MSRILVVDDEPLIALLAVGWLEDLGHEPVGPAHSLASAMELVETTEIDAAIIDLSLGRQSGVPLAERLAEQGVPFVFATGHDAASIGQRDLAVAILTKPFAFDAFKTAVQALTEKA